MLLPRFGLASARSAIGVCRSSAARCTLNACMRALSTWELPADVLLEEVEGGGRKAKKKVAKGDRDAERQRKRVLRRRGERADSVNEDMEIDRAMHAERMATAKLNRETINYIRSQKLGLVKNWHNQASADRRRMAIADRQRNLASSLGATGVGMHIDWARLNRESLPEVAIIGHANCGKSSLLNALCGTKTKAGPAAVSSRAGWTAELGFYRATVAAPPQRRAAQQKIIAHAERQLELQAAAGDLGLSDEQREALVNETERRREEQRVRQEAEGRGTSLVLVDTPGYGFTVGDQQQLREWGELIADYLNNSPRLRLAVLLVDATRGLCPADIRVLRRVRKSAIPVLVALTKADLLDPDDLAASHSVICSDLDALAKTFPDSGRVNSGRAAVSAEEGGAGDMGHGCHDDRGSHEDGRGGSNVPLRAPTAGGAPTALYVPKLHSPPLILSSTVYKGVTHFWKVVLRETARLDADERFVSERESRTSNSLAGDAGRSMQQVPGGSVREATMPLGRARRRASAEYR